jgi:hypothetical protein
VSTISGIRNYQVGPENDLLRSMGKFNVKTKVAAWGKCIGRDDGSQKPALIAPKAPALHLFEAAPRIRSPVHPRPVVVVLLLLSQDLLIVHHRRGHRLF